MINLKEHPLNKVEEAALELYRQWQNEWGRRHDGDAAYQHTIEDFFSSHWEETYHISDQRAAYHHLYIMSAGTGDDGGACRLYIFGGLRPTDEEVYYIQYILHEFDTMFATVYDADKGGLVY